MAEGVGFEPTRTCALTVFKTVAIDHSANPPFLRGVPILFLNKMGKSGTLVKSLEGVPKFSSKIWGKRAAYTPRE